MEDTDTVLLLLLLLLKLELETPRRRDDITFSFPCHSRVAFIFPDFNLVCREVPFVDVTVILVTVATGTLTARRDISVVTVSLEGFV